MKSDLQKVLFNWPKRVIRNADLAPLLPGSDYARRSLLKRAIAERLLTPVVRGVYLVEEPYAKGPVNRFEIAQMIEGSSYVSFESALSYHQLIPEAVYVTSCATSNRTKEIHTEKGDFLFQHIPVKNFFLGVERMVDSGSVYLMATPWRALADHCFVFRRPWLSPESVYEDLRIDEENLAKFSKGPLKRLVEGYPSPRVRQLLRKFL